MSDEDLEEHYREVAGDGSARRRTGAIMDSVAERLQSADGMSSKLDELQAAGSAIAVIAEEADDPAEVTDIARSAAGDAAQRSGTAKDLIVDEIMNTVGEVEKEAVRESEPEIDGKTLGFDNFLEKKLDEVVFQRSTDAAEDTTLRWRFGSGAVVETDRGEHFAQFEFFRELADATNDQVVPMMASEEVEDTADNEEEYAELSVGPKERPWSRSNDLWSQAISSLVDERSREEEVLGARTEAWESLRDRIAAGRGVRDRNGAVENGLIHLPDDLEEIWVPTSWVAEACDTLELNRRKMQTELVERGIDTDALSGGGISEAISTGKTAARYWRLDATHPNVPQPETVLDNVDEGATRSQDVDTDGGHDDNNITKTETFGRTPDDKGRDA